MSTLPNIFPAAKADLFQDNAPGALPEKNGGSSEQFADWMSRALSPGLSAKSPATAGTPEVDASAVASAEKTDSFSSHVTDGLLEKTSADQSQFDEATSGAATLTTFKKLSATNEAPATDAARMMANLPPALPATSVPVSVTPKKSQPDGKTSDSGHSKPVENQSATDQSATPVNVSLAINPEIPLAQNSVPSPMLAEGAMNFAAANGTVFQPATPVSKNNSGNNSSAAGKAIAIIPQSSSPSLSSAAALNVNTPAGATTSSIASAVSVTAEIAATFPEIKNVPAVNAKNSDPDISQNPPFAEDVSKIQTDSRKKAAPAGSTSSAVKITATAPQIAVDPKTAALSPAAQPISSATAEVNLKTPKADVMAATSFSPAGFSGLPVPDGKTVAPTASFADGTSAAIQGGLMGDSEKTSKIAVLAGKFLPGSAAVASRGNDLTSRPEQIFTAASAGAADQSSPAAGTVSAATPVENSLADDVRAQALERAHDAIALHALSLNGAEADSLQVVIKPGAGTQLSLELRQRGDGVEVQAVLQQGDFKHLSQQWPELQQRLEQRGIKLTALATDGNFANGGNDEMFQQRKNQAENQPVGPVAEMSFSAPLTGTFTKPAARAVATAGWETWA